MNIGKAEICKSCWLFSPRHDGGRCRATDCPHEHYLREAREEYRRHPTKWVKHPIWFTLYTIFILALFQVLPIGILTMFWNTDDRGLGIAVACIIEVSTGPLALCGIIDAHRGWMQ